MKVMREDYQSTSEKRCDLLLEEERPNKKKRIEVMTQFLPEELILEIFTFLGCQQAALDILPVCKSFNDAGTHFPPIRLLRAVKQMRAKEWALSDINTDFLQLSESSSPVTARLQEQFAVMIASLDTRYQGTQKLLELTSIIPSLHSNSYFSELVENNRYLFDGLVKSNGMMLKYVGPQLQRDLQILQNGVQANKLALEFVPNDLKPKIQETLYREIHLYQLEERSVAGTSREAPRWMAQHIELTSDIFDELEQWINEF